MRIESLLVEGRCSQLRQHAFESGAGVPSGGVGGENGREEVGLAYVATTRATEVCRGCGAEGALRSPFRSLG